MQRYSKWGGEPIAAVTIIVPPPGSNSAFYGESGRILEIFTAQSFIARGGERPRPAIISPN